MAEPTHITRLRTYTVVLVALLALTALTTAAAFVDLGTAGTPVALAIAGIKATIVGLFFMHLRESSQLTLAIAVSALFWLGILLVLTMTDYLTRQLLTYG